MNPTASTKPPATLAQSLGAAHVGLREDLEVSRHVFRGEVSYVVRDPMTFQSQRLSLEDYEIFVRIQAGEALSTIFARLVEEERLEPASEEQFYQFVLMLHRLGFLRLPISDDKALYQRYQARQRARRKEKLFGFLFLRLPLWNPDAFLGRTIYLARPFFSTGAYVLWAALCTAAGFVAFQHAGDLVQPIHGVLVAKNLPLLIATLIVLKVIHEFGHAFACKHYGGHVPEMGAYLIVFTPCAYVDASACWGFPRKRQRLMVCAAGMYVESFCAAIAVLVWAATGPSLINSIAYNVIFLAGVVTVLFNANPLMRYDGYYILSDWLEIPNLRQRSAHHVLNGLKRLFLGVQQRDDRETFGLRWILFGYGYAAGLYRVALLLTIAGVLATKFKAAGMAVGVLFLGAAAATVARKLTRYLWHAEETAAVRVRAISLGMLVFIVLPAAVFWLPLGGQVLTAGVVSAEHEVVIRPRTAGFVERIEVIPGSTVLAGDAVATIQSDAPGEAILEAQAGLTASRIRVDALRVKDRSRIEQEQARAAMYQAALQKAVEDQEGLAMFAPVDGRIVESLNASALGRYLQVGEPVAMLTAGATRIRTVVSEEQLARTHILVGDRIEFRLAAAPSKPLETRIVRILPSGSREITLPSLTQSGTQDIPVDQLSAAAQQPYFEVVLEVIERDGLDLRYGMTGYALFSAQHEPIGKTLGRRVLRFWERLMQG